ncbi:hypothetical protein SAMN05421819_3029 [Bryocella elongata]|uniref:DUF2029 domain-containing protein n=1 Tax=Bryocella elongata TaxID=863522 RepID=A0A1H6AB25_9BACT|nr:hypothetical protein [Bryocella elongata]SEG45651.1 hypothetical protein SAMN05421819_3029 [Bryocella elongata]
MTGTQTLAARGALGVIGATATVLAGRYRLLPSAQRVSWNRIFLLLFGLSRLLVFGLLFGVLHVDPRGDIPAYYFPEATRILAGQRPYLDFVTSYAPLHAYLDAAALRLHNAPHSIILLAIAFELALMAVWSAIPERYLGEDLRRQALTLYLVNPLSVLFVTVDGQDNVLIALFFALAVYVLLKQKTALSGVAFALSVCAVKFLALLYVPLFIVVVRRWWLWALTFVATMTAVYGVFIAVGANVLIPLGVEGDYRGAGCIPFVIETFLGRLLRSAIWDALTALAVIAVAGALFVFAQRALRGVDAERTRSAQLFLLVHGATAVTMAVLLLSKKSWSTYVLLALYPICLTVLQSKRIYTWGFAVFLFVAAVEHSFWSSILGQPTAVELHALLLKGNRNALELMVLEILLLAGYAMLLGLSLRRLTELGQRVARHTVGQPIEVRG